MHRPSTRVHPIRLIPVSGHPMFHDFDRRPPGEPGRWAGAEDQPSVPDGAVSTSRLHPKDPLQNLEVPDGGQGGVAGLLVDPSCGGVPRVAAGLDHRHGHS